MSVRKLALALGTVQFDLSPQIDILEQRCEEATSQKQPDAPKICVQILKYISEMDGGLDIYDSRWPATNLTDMEAILDAYLNNPNVNTHLLINIGFKTAAYRAIYKGS